MSGLMPVALLCLGRSVREEDLRGTVLWRGGFRRHTAPSLSEAFALAKEHPHIIVLDAALPWADELIRRVRADAKTRQVSIVALADRDADSSVLDFIDAGANAVLRLPPDADWDKRLARLIQVAPRRDHRLSVLFDVTTSPLGTTRPAPAVTVDISESGMLIECSGLEVGMDVAFTLRLPGGSGEVLEGEARVVRSGPGDRCGLQFSSISGEGFEAIREFVARARL